MNYTLIKDFIISFFNTLSENNVDYCVLRGYENLPDKPGRDIDVLIKFDDNLSAMKYIINVIHLLGWDVYVKTNQDGFFTLICSIIFEKSISILQLDFWTSLNWRGIKWCDSNYVLSNKQVFNNINVANKGSEAAIVCLKELVSKKPVDKKYYNLLYEASCSCSDEFLATLRPLSDLSSIILKKCVNKNFSDLNSLQKKIRRKLRNEHFIKYLTESTIRLVFKTKSLFKPKGRFIVFLGPDGSGKSTLIHNLLPFLSPYFGFSKTFHMRYNILPKLKTGHGFSSMKGKLNNDEPLAKGKKRKNKRSFLSILASWFVVVYYKMEFVLGNHIIRKIKRNNGLALYDRYFYDFFIQPTTRDLIFRFRWNLLLFVKKPDLIIHLDADPNIVFLRKQELSATEIGKQNFYLKKLLNKNKNTIVLDTSENNAESLCVLAYKVIREKLLQRF